MRQRGDMVRQAARSSVYPRGSQPEGPLVAGGPGPAARASSRLDVADAPGAGRRLYHGLLLALWLGVAGVGLIQGFEYYRLPLMERAYSPLHEEFKPAGTIGHALGVAGSLMMLGGVLMYSTRKRAAVLSRAGKLKYWLELHIFLCTLGPFLVLLHTSFRFGGIISIAFWSMAVVVASGVFGRWVYARIPNTINGRFLSMQGIEEERDRLLEQVASRSGLPAADVAQLLHTEAPPTPRGFIHALYLAARSDLIKRRQVRHSRRLFTAARVPRGIRDNLEYLIRTRMQLEQQMMLLKPFQRLFRYWHLLHLPLAIVMLLIVILHVIVAVLFGYA